MENVLMYLEDAADKFPEKTAVADKDNRLSYSELRSLSKSIGAELAKFHKTNSPVCVYAEHSVFTLAYFFGILYSGNYYVPIDPDMPVEKKQMIFDDCSPFAVCGNIDERVRIENCAVIGMPGKCNFDGMLPISGGGTTRNSYLYGVHFRLDRQTERSG